MASISLIRCLRSGLVLFFIRSNCSGFIAEPLAAGTLKVARFADHHRRLLANLGAKLFGTKGIIL
jgi:hypothetical protein